MNTIHTQINNALLTLANPNNASAMSAYMKNKFLFLGIKAQLRKEATSKIILNCKNFSVTELINLVQLLWKMEHREFQYVALDILLKYYKKLSLEHINTLLAIVQQKSWWDSVDNMAAVINKIIKSHLPTTINPQKVMDEAILSNNLWVRRVAIIHQLGWKQQTDTKRLFKYSLLQASDTNFFIRKAIGWALRDYAKYNSQEVYEFLDSNKAIWSNLTYKEATKHKLA